jgi:hypothetical protein
MNKLLVLLLLIPVIALADDHTISPKGVSANVQKVQLCTPGYTKTVRPAVSYTNKLKMQWTPAGHKPSEYELDHYIPIELGGSPTDLNNLWLQVWSTARIKDVQENLLHRDLCNGVYTIEQVQASIRKWK